MITSSDIYWITRLDGLCGLLLGLSILAGIGLIIAAVYFFVVWDENDKISPVATKALVLAAILFSIFVSGAVLTPSTKEMAAIILVPKIANNQHVQAIPDKAATILEGELDKWIKSLDDTKK